MKKKRNRFISCLLSACLLGSALPAGVATVSAQEEIETYAQETVGGSVILHCFDWSYNSIKAALPDIAAAGYTAVQTSPVQAPKDYNAAWTDRAGQWFKLYQPLGLSIADGNTWLGTKSELRQLCAEAEKYGIKVIVDIVANHLANNGTDGGTYSSLSVNAEADMKNEAYYHADADYVNDDSRYNITHRHMGKPDLNTGNSEVQQKVLSLLCDCVDCGVDGFRFDAAKHIEVPGDPDGTASDFWPTVINGVQTYAGKELYFYGEILGNPGPGCDISNYTQYMCVTDEYTGDHALDKAYYNSAGELADSSYHKGVGASNSVVWVESHDTYLGEAGSAGIKNTSGVSDDVITRAWAIVASRGDSTSLFFARPSTVMGEASADETWKSKAVAEVNKFKNVFDGKSEYLSSSGNVAYNERGNKGVVISKLDGGGYVNLTAHAIADGTYTDQVTGNTFTVSNGVISGTVGSTGVAVVYDPENVNGPYITAKTLYFVPNSTWNAQSPRYAMYLFNGSGYRWVSMENLSNGAYSANVPTDKKWNNVIFCAMDPDSSENSWDNVKYQTNDLYPEGESDCFTLSSGVGNKGSGSWSVYTGQIEPTTVVTEDSYTIYVNNPLDWNSINVYCWGGDSDMGWPGVSMTPCGGQVYSAVIPNNVEGMIFNDGNMQQTVDIYAEDIHNGAYWVINNETNWQNHYTVNSPTYYLVGTMNYWQTSSEYAFSPCFDTPGVLEFKLSGVFLNKNDEVKVLGNNDGWYPSYGNNYVVPADGTYDVLFRPNGDGGDGWYEHYFKLNCTAPANCTVTYLDDNGFVLDTVETAYNTAADEPDEPEKEGYNFEGWYLGDELYDFTAPVTSDITLTAKWSFADGVGAVLAGHSLSLEGFIGVNFYMDLADSVLNNENAYMQFSIWDEKKYDFIPFESVSMSDAVEKQVGTKTYYAFKCHVAAKDMTTPIEALIVGDGVEGANPHDYTVKDYANYILEDEDYSEVHNLIRRMLLYGGEAQRYFNYRIDDLASNNVQEMNSMLETILDNYGFEKNYLDGDIFAGATLSLKSETTLSLYFESDEELTFSNAEFLNGEKQVETARVGSYQVARIRGINAKELGEIFEVEVKGHGYIQYSPMDYVKLAQESGSDDLKELTRYLGDYYFDAKNFFDQ